MSENETQGDSEATRPAPGGTGRRGSSGAPQPTEAPKRSQPTGTGSGSSSGTAGSRLPQQGGAPTRVGSYAVDEVLGRGGMGVVYRAFDLRLQRAVALKALPLHLASNAEERERLQDEARAMARVLHPNVAVVYGLVDDEREGTTYLALELVEGEALNLRLQEGPLPPTEARALLRQVAKALAAIHHRGLVHRDLKPSNVMVTPEGEAKVLDFGLATALGGGLAPAEGHAVGSPGYMSPEQADGRVLDPRTDVWAWGCVAYECFTGQRAFPGADLEERLSAIRNEEPDYSSWPSEAGDASRELVRACLSKSPQGRPRSMEIVLAALAAAEEDSAARARRPKLALPSERDAFVGREVELDSLARFFEAGARLVTLLGPGGIGKTRLATRHAWRSVQRSTAGAWFCDLSEARSAEGIVEAVASALDVAVRRADPIQQIGDVLSGHGPALLVLDNFEQVAEHAEATVGRWLELAPEARFLVTSRSRLYLGGEELLNVEPLRPEEEGLELFVERARTHHREFELTDTNREEVEQLVRLLEGMPLAIELAAARVRVLSPARLLERMSDRFAILSAARGPKKRQSTLEATIDWSWNLLQPWQQAALAQCSVFEGGFTLDAAEAVLDLEAWPEAPHVIDIVQSLLDESLLRSWTAEQAGRRQGYEEPLFGTWLSIKDYAGRKLADAGAVPGATGPEARLAAEARHGSWHARYGDPQSLDRVDSLDGSPHLRAMGLALDDLMAACTRAVERDDPDVATRTLLAAWAVLQARGPMRLGASLARRVLAMSSLSDRQRALALKALARALAYSSSLRDARVVIEEGLDLVRRAGLRGLEAAFLGMLANGHREGGDVERAREGHEQSLALHRELGDEAGQAIALHQLGNVHLQEGRREDAKKDYAESLELSVAADDRRSEAAIRASLGLMQLEDGDIPAAEANMRLAIEVSSTRGDRNYEASAWGYLGNLRLETGDFREASTCYERSVRLSREVGDLRAEAITLGNLAQLERALGRTDVAREHLLRARRLHRRVANRRSEGAAVHFLGLVEHDEGNLDAARERLEEALAIHREVDHVRFAGVALRDLGAVHDEAGRVEEARRCLEEGLDMLHELGDWRLEVAAKVGLAQHHVGRGDLERARELLDEAEPGLRRCSDAFELPTLLAARCELARAAGRADEARAWLAELEESVASFESGPGTTIGRRLARLRASLEPVE